MNGLLLQAPGDRFERHGPEDALWLLKKFGDSADKRKTIGDLARMRFSGDLSEPGGGGTRDRGIPPRVRRPLTHGLRA